MYNTYTIENVCNILRTQSNVYAMHSSGYDYGAWPARLLPHCVCAGSCTVAHSHICRCISLSNLNVYECTYDVRDTRKPNLFVPANGCVRFSLLVWLYMWCMSVHERKKGIKWNVKRINVNETEQPEC